MDNMELELKVMNLVVDSGSARSYAMEAIAFAKDGEFAKADEVMKSSDDEFAKAHHSQTELIQSEAKGEKIDMSLIVVHAQDHLMTSGVVRDLAKEIITIHKKMADK